MVREILKAHTTNGVRKALRDLARELAMQWRCRPSRKYARNLNFEADIKLNLGCGPNLRNGWVNVDLFESGALALDLREPFPFPSRYVSRIYCSHFLEHLEYPEYAVGFVDECFRVLKPGGIIHLVVPDTALQLRAYLENDEAYFKYRLDQLVEWRSNNPMHLLNYDLRQGSDHKYSYDSRTLNEILVNAGFASIETRAFDSTIDLADHEMESLYVDAIKA